MCASSVSRSVIWRFRSMMMPTAARVIAAKCGGDRGGGGELLGAQHRRDLLGAASRLVLSCAFEG